ncbi:MAG: OB-fold nucleic acid binding domain-containing protein, partial [Poseidonia sp.]
MLGGDIELDPTNGQTGASMAKTVWIGEVQDGLYDGKTVELKGWIKRTRGSNKMRFIVLRDSTGEIQCVGKKDTIGEEAFL